MTTARVFTAEDLIYSYSRAQAIEDGVLIDVSETASEAGFRFPVAMTAAVWGGCVAVSAGLEGTGQSESGRLWDVFWMAAAAIREAKAAGYKAHPNPLPFDVSVMDRLTRSGRPHYTLERLNAHCGPGDDGEPVITIMRPNED